MINPDEPHDGRSATGRGYTYRMMYVEPNMLARLLDHDSVGVRSTHLPLFRSPIIEDPSLAAEYLRLHRALETQALGALETESRMLTLGNLILGEISGGVSERVVRIEQTLGKALKIRVTPNLRAVIWSKLLINCSVTTIGAITGQTMRKYIRSSIGKEIFCRVYQETLAVALASGTRPERMIVEPVPPRCSKEEAPLRALDTWLDGMVAAYGNAKASMLQDLERGRRTEIDFINGYVARLARKIGLPTPMNSAITSLVHQLEQKRTRPHPQQLEKLLVKAAFLSRSPLPYCDLL